MYITVPQGTIVHIQDIILHHLDPDRHDVEIEIMDTFVGQNLTTEDDIQQQLLAEGTKTVKSMWDYMDIQQQCLDIETSSLTRRIRLA